MAVFPTGILTLPNKSVPRPWNYSPTAPPEHREFGSLPLENPSSLSCTEGPFGSPTPFRTVGRQDQFAQTDRQRSQSWRGPGYSRLTAVLCHLPGADQLGFSLRFPFARSRWSRTAKGLLAGCRRMRTRGGSHSAMLACCAATRASFGAEEPGFLHPWMHPSSVRLGCAPFAVGNEGEPSRERLRIPEIDPDRSKSWPSGRTFDDGFQSQPPVRDATRVRLHFNPLCTSRKSIC